MERLVEGLFSFGPTSSSSKCRYPSGSLARCTLIKVRPTKLNVPEHSLSVSSAPPEMVKLRDVKTLAETYAANGTPRPSFARAYNQAFLGKVSVWYVFTLYAGSQARVTSALLAC